MTTAERAQAAADFLNAGERWRVKDCTEKWPSKRLGMWHIERLLSGFGREFWDSSQSVIDLAIAEGWQENETQNVPIAGAETGQPGDYPPDYFTEKVRRRKDSDSVG